MVGYSPGTGRKDRDAGTIALPLFTDSTGFVAWLPAVKGKLVLVAEPQLSCRPPDDWHQNATPASDTAMMLQRAASARDWQARIRATGYSMALGGGTLGIRLEQAGAAGIVTSRPKLSSFAGGWGTMEIFETYNTRAPAIALSCEDYGLVFRLTEAKQNPRLRLNLDADLTGERPVFNTVATIPGTEKPDEYVVLSSHFDSWDGSSGATDNGTGTLTMLEAMRILKLVLPHPKRTIIAGHWSGEEEGEVGSKAFTEDHPEVITGLQALFNQDNGTGRVVQINAGGLPSSAVHLTRWLSRIPKELQDQVNYSGSPGRPAGGGSDDFSFTCYGAPIFGMGSLDFDYFAYTWHTDRDTYDKVVFDDLKANATLTAMLAYQAAEDSTTITRERVDLVALAVADSIRAAQAAAAAGPGARGGRGNRFGRFRPPTTWPVCEKAARTTNPRLR